jgi:hypothetical protein
LDCNKQTEGTPPPNELPVQPLAKAAHLRGLLSPKSLRDLGIHLGCKGQIGALV